MTDASPALLEVVPWNYGFAHSWALAWLAENPASRDAVLGLLAPGTAGPYEIYRLERELRIAGARADLAVRGRARDGRRMCIAVETKVADPIRADQLDAYREEDYDPVLFLPGLTGLLFEPNLPVAGERAVTGRQLADALDGMELPHIVDTYVRSVGTEAARMRAARAVARGELETFDQEGFTPAKDLRDAAWVVEVVELMRAAGADDVRVRSERNDRGLFWAGGYVTPAGVTEDAGMWIDVLAEIRTDRRAVAIKAGGDPAGRLSCYDAAVTREPGYGWTRGRRVTKPETFTVWKLDVTGRDARETAQHALAAGEYLRSLG